MMLVILRYEIKGVNLKNVETLGIDDCKPSSQRNGIVGNFSGIHEAANIMFQL